MRGPYTIQVIPDASVRSGEHYRITDADDNRVATCYLRENAETVCRALNAAAPQEAREGEAVKAMDAMWRTLEPYVRHARGCSYDPTSNDPASEYCTCDLAGAKARLRDMREKLAAAARPAPETREPDVWAAPKAEWHRGFHDDRLSLGDGCRTDVLENAFARLWREWNAPDRAVQPTLHGLMIVPGSETMLRPPRFYAEIGEHEARIVATVVQWLGSNVGFSFVEEALGAYGYQIVRRDRLGAPAPAEAAERSET